MLIVYSKVRDCYCCSFVLYVRRRTKNFSLDSKHCLVISTKSLNVKLNAAIIKLEGAEISLCCRFVSKYHNFHEKNSM